MKILLLGSNGQVGQALTRSLSPFGELIISDRKHLDLTNLQSIESTITQINPDIIVNASAYTAVDLAEKEQSICLQINHLAIEKLASIAKQQDILLIHYSTDYVFNGNGTTPYTENQPTDPINSYGKSKLLGEQAIIDSGCRHFIFRTCWVYSLYGNNFPKTIIKLATDRPELKIINDQIGTPTSAELIADITALCLYKHINQAFDHYGVYNLTSNGDTTWYEFAKYFIEKLSSMGVELSCNSQNIVPIPTSEYPTPAKRPNYSVLDIQKLENNLQISIPNWKHHVDIFCKQIIHQL